MKDKLNRLANGIWEEEPMGFRIRPEEFSGEVPADGIFSFVMDAESESGRNVKGALFCDDERVELTVPSFSGRMNHLSFSVNTAGLTGGDTISGVISFLTAAGEFSVPYRFTVAMPDEEEEVRMPETVTGEAPELRDEENPEREFLKEYIPEDDELLSAVCGILIGGGAEDVLSYRILKEAVRRGLPVTHLYESYLASYPESCPEPVLREALLYYSYERNLPEETAEKLYRSVIENEPERSELYRLYEPNMREYAAKSVLKGRINKNLSVIYDRMLYPELVDSRMARILPELIMTHKITVSQSFVKTATVRYPELSEGVTRPVTDGICYLPVFSEPNIYSFRREDGSKAEGVSYTDEPLFDRPDLLRRSFELCPQAELTELSASKKAVSEGTVRSEEKELLVKALCDLPLVPSFRQDVVRVLCAAEGGLSWMDEVPKGTFDDIADDTIFRAYLRNGRYRDAYLLLRSTGSEGKKLTDISALFEELLRTGDKPVAGTETDRFFRCLSKKVFDEGLAGTGVLTLLSEEYQGSVHDMAAIFREASEAGIPAHEISERLLTTCLFTGTAEGMDEAFISYIAGGVPNEVILKAYFVRRMSEFFECEDRTAPLECFKVLESYLAVHKEYASLPEILPIGLTKYYSEKESLTESETALCQDLTDFLIAKDLIFLHTKVLKKKVRIPSSIGERFYLEYRGTAKGSPELMIRIRPQEEEYHSAELKHVYGRVFVAGISLFLGEELNYRIIDESSGKDPAMEGTIKVKKLHLTEENRYAVLNRMSELHAKGKTEELKKEMAAYSVLRETGRILFQIE